MVAINSFTEDTSAEIELIKKLALEAGASACAVSDHWADGSDGAEALAEAVAAACAEPELPFKFLYDLEQPIEDKIETIVKEIYRGDGIELSEQAKSDIARYKAQGFNDLPICMAKTHLSFSADPSKKGAPTGFTVPIREVRASVGGGFLYPLIGDMSTMPGLPTRPAYYDIDLDADTGTVTGLF